MLQREGEDGAAGAPKQPLGRAQRVRGETLDQILRFVDQKRSFSSPGVLVISGPPGIGKTWTIEQVLEKLLRSPQPRLILRARGYFGETEFQFAGLNQLLRPILMEAKQLPTPERVALRAALSGATFTSEGSKNLHRIATGTHSLLERLSSSQPVVLLVDNAHWLDAPTRRTLTYLSHRIAGTNITMVAATRDVTIAADLEGHHIALQYLDDETARALVRQTTPHLPTAAVDHIVESAGGMPLALVEIAQLPDLEARIEMSQKFLPGDVLDLLPPGATLLEDYRERISWMSATELRAAVTVALEELSLSQMVAVFDELGVEIGDLAASEHAGLIEWIHGTPRIIHPTVRGALHELVPGSEQVMVRKAIGTVLVDDPARAAKHLVALLENTVPEVADTLEEAAKIAATGGEHFESGRLWELASRRTPPANHETKRQRMRQAVEENLQAGSQLAAERCTRDLLTLAQTHDDPALEITAHRLWLEINYGVGSPLTLLRGAGRAQNIDAVVPVLNVARNAASQAPREVAELLTTLMNILSARGRHEDARTVVDIFKRHIPSGISSLESELLIESIERGNGHPQPQDLLFGSWPEILNDDALVRFFQTADSLLTTMIWSDSRGVNELIYRHQKLVSERNLTATAGRTALLHANLAHRDGHWQEALTRYGEAEQALWRTDFRGAAPTILLFQAWLTALMGDAQATGALLARVREARSARSPVIEALANAIGGMLNYSLGRCESALRHFERSVDMPQLFGVAHPIVPALFVAHAEALWRMRRYEEARGLVTSFEERVAIKESTRHQAFLARCHGFLDTDFTHHFEEAVRKHTDSRQLRGSAEDRDFDLARTVLMWGMRLRRARQKREASKKLHEALAIFTNIGAESWASMTRSELKACGERHVETTGLPQHLKALTPREYEIASAAADGATNSEIAGKLGISPRTVEQHLGAAFRKLNVRRRTELKRLIPKPG